MVILLDTDVVIEGLRGNSAQSAWENKLFDDGHAFACSSVTVGELYAGIRASEEGIVAERLAATHILSVTPDVAVRAGRLSSALRIRGRTVHLDDLFIAATAIEHGLELATRNTKDFAHIPGLRLLPLA